MEANLWLRFFRDAWVEPAPKITNLQHIRDFLCVVALVSRGNYLN
jgi:hypothetical protein